MEFVKFGGEGGRGYIASGAEATVITFKTAQPGGRHWTRRWTAGCWNELLRMSC
ncbi:MAG: hypothetical protein E7L01_24680 [Paenibacillus macerans]|uniref:hypothetical protein n=1 Tax=Paenibacillus macerans TaxID=44252 RepID=UPI000ABE8B0B|nr:hypothetical protein [Paenibacillus macerans]MBS5912898.1 hypothetical protein [Paenibacillus macerans]MCY7562647.1 hypothetical protein [Paenibacillus macerans]MDU5949975.1 hypothetical protein [Paenibacillus macerans]MDU7476509.1 hypothetical protein [Paenibacillus macerans]MEC0140339.1 hypothetical protein [Paenibacillus macerans]